LIDYLWFYVPLKNFSFIWRRHHYREGLQNLGYARRLGPLNREGTPAVTRGLGFSGLIRRTAPFSHLLRHTRRCGGFIPTRILTVSYTYHKQVKVVHVYYYMYIEKEKPLGIHPGYLFLVIPSDEYLTTKSLTFLSRWIGSIDTATT
jgi:hypothetical protein